MNKAVFLLAAALVAGAPVYAQSQAFTNLDADQADLIRSGAPVFREPSGWKTLAVPEGAFFRSELLAEVKSGGYNYLGEVLMTVDAARASALIPELKKRLGAVEEYAGIPYWSRRQQTYYDLFDWVRITGGRRTASSASITCQQYMKPFGEYSSVYTWEFTDERLFFSGVNTSELSYDGVKAVRSGNMIWRMYAYKEGSTWVLYGIGAVKAFDMFGILRDRLSASFMGRIEAFFKHAYGIKVARDD